MREQLDRGTPGLRHLSARRGVREDRSARSATEMADHLQAEVFPAYRVALLHGRMKQDAKDRVMQAFAAGEMQILVSTTVVEVGVDVPNATVMVVEHAERFGLSQLHQLRGRVGRGACESYCFLLYQAPWTDDARERLKAMADDDRRLRDCRARSRSCAARAISSARGSRDCRSCGPVDLVRDRDIMERPITRRGARRSRRPHAELSGIRAAAMAGAVRADRSWVGTATLDVQGVWSLRQLDSGTADVGSWEIGRDVGEISYARHRGQFKGRRLKAPTWDGLRPTSDKLRETLFNILAPRIEGARVLDGYAGTGAVGLEALSRGAAHVTFVERTGARVALIEENLAACGVENGYAIALRSTLPSRRRGVGARTRSIDPARSAVRRSRP